MSRKRKNGIGNKRQENLNRINRNVRNKLNRIRKNYNMMVDINIKRASEFNNVQEYNKYMQEMKSFLNPHNQNYRYVKSKTGNVMTKKEYNQLERTLARENRVKREEARKREKMPYKHGGKKTGVKTGEQQRLMGDPRLREAKHKVKNKFHELPPQKFVEWLQEVEEEFGGNVRDKRARRYKDSYIKGLQNVFGDEANHIINHIEKMGNKQFLDVYYSNTVGDIGYIYLPVERKRKLKNIAEGLGVA
jgi:hypothetical protein